MNTIVFGWITGSDLAGEDTECMTPVMLKTAGEQSMEPKIMDIDEATDASICLMMQLQRYTNGSQ